MVADQKQLTISNIWVRIDNFSGIPLKEHPCQGILALYRILNKSHFFSKDRNKLSVSGLEGFHNAHIYCIYMTYVICADFERDPEDNPADFFLDTIITNEIATGISASQECKTKNFIL